MGHRIRLHGPWDVTPANPDLPAGRMTIPGTLRDGGWKDFVGRVVLHRRFGMPTNLSADERVWLVFERVVGPGRVWINRDLLGDIEGSARFDITDHLAERNGLRVEISAADDLCGIVSAVAIEIVQESPK